MKINGAELQKLRLSKGFSQSQLAKKCNISLSALRKYEHGERNPKPVVIDKDYSRIRCAWLQGYWNYKRRQNKSNE